MEPGGRVRGTPAPAAADERGSDRRAEPGGPTTGAGLVENCRQGLGELGYVEGRDYTFEARYAEDDDRTHGWHPYGLQSVQSR
jgi:hypothetical protein